MKMKVGFHGAYPLGVVGEGGGVAVGVVVVAVGGCDVVIVSDVHRDHLGKMRSGGGETMRNELY